MSDYTKHVSNIIKLSDELRASNKSGPDSSLAQLQLCKNIFDVQLRLCDTNHFGLTELYVHGLDKEQVWQQIELINNNWYKIIEEAKKQVKSNHKIQNETEKNPIEESFEEDDKSDFDDNEESDDERVKQIMKKVRFTDDVKDETDEALFEDFSDDEEEEEGEDDENVDEEKDEEGKDVDDESEGEEEFERKAKKPKLDNAKSNNNFDDPMEMFKRSIQNSKKQANKDGSGSDRFFNISEMNAFLDQQDALEGRKKKSEDSDDEDSEDYDDEDAPIKYDDFFDQPDEDDDEPEPVTKTKEATNLSSFEKRVEMMKKKATQLEDKNVAEKQWQMKGEVTHEDRPINSLIDKQLEFGVATQPTLTTTPEIMKKIEEILCQRAASQVWDGPKRKIKTKEAAFTLNKKVVLDQEKSKLSLAEIYENEYLEQIKGKEEKLPEEIEEIQTSMTSLFRKLDALSNFHFNPKPALPDVKIVTNAAAMTMEEVAPVAMSEATTLAPEEILDKNKKGLLGDTERSDTDKKRANRLRKKKQHFIKIDKEDREKVKKLKAEKRTMHKSGTDAHLDSKEIKKKPKTSGKRKFVRQP